MAASEILILRTNRADARVWRLLEQYRGMAGIDLIVAADERGGVLDLPAGVDRVRMSDDNILKMGLPAVPDWGWRCGDYSLAAVREARPGYRYYWMIEPDVTINMADPARLFRRFAHAPHDFLTTALSQRDASWRPFRPASHFYTEVWGCLFPLVRLSGEAIDHLLARRRVLHGEWERANARSERYIRWPNDESFVGSELAAAGRKLADFNQIHPGTYTPQEGWAFDFPVHADAAMLRKPDGRIYHPVVEGDAAFVERMVRMIEKRGPQNIERLLGRVAWSLATVPRTRGPDGVSASAGADTVLRALLAASRFPKLHDGLPAMAKGLFPPRRAGIRPIRHQRVARRAPEGFAVAQSDDFKLGPELPAEVFPRQRATPYAANFRRRLLGFACVSRDADLLTPPFFYNAQRAAAESIAWVPFERLAALYPVADPAGAGAASEPGGPTILMSIGRCGSTLLNQLMRADGSVTVSEPDVFSQVAGLLGTLPAQQGRDPAALRADAVRVLRASVGALCDWAGVPAERMVLKLRSQSNQAVAPIVEAFPQARYVFVFRALEPWVRSFVTAFGHDAPRLVFVMRNAVKACDALVQAGARPRVIWYEDMRSDPASVIQTIRGAEGSLDAAEKAEIARIIGVDSQAGTRISRAARTRQDAAATERRVAATWAAFQEIWDRQRPGAEIDRLGLPF